MAQHSPLKRGAGDDNSRVSIFDEVAEKDYIDLSKCTGYGQCVTLIGSHIRDLDI